METFLIAARFAHFGATMLLFGASLFRLYAGISFGARERASFDDWLTKVLLSAAILALVSALMWLDALAVTMSGDWREALSVETVGAVLFETAFGAIWKWRLGIAALLICVLLSSARDRTHLAAVLIFALAAGLLLSLALVGHAAMEEGARGILHQVVQGLHLAAAATWIGGLVPLGYLLSRAAADRNGAQRRLAAGALPRFSHVGYFAVSFVLLSGVWLTWRMTAGFAGLFGTPYGRIVLTKTALFALMTAAALFNRLYLLPGAGGFAAKGVGSLRLLWRSVIFEQGIALAILVAASLLGTLEP